MARNNGNGNGGPSRNPSRRLTKKLQYTEVIKLNNSTSSYAYLSRYVRPNLAAPVGAAVQFAAYELFRLKSFKVSVQMANNDTTVATSQLDPINVASTATIWTAVDWGANETVSGESIMQYQNAKKNTCSLNQWKCIVNAGARINGTLGVTGANTSSFILPSNTWVNTAGYGDSTLFEQMYSGYQLFIQVFGPQNQSVALQPSFTIVTELNIEFMQPAFQNNPSAFTVGAFDMKMVTQPNSSDPTELRAYVFNRYTVETNTSTGEREMTIHLKREDGVSGSLTFTSDELRAAIISGTSGSYFGGRPIVYDGPLPPVAIPQQDLLIESL